MRTSPHTVVRVFRVKRRSDGRAGGSVREQWRVPIRSDRCNLHRKTDPQTHHRKRLETDHCECQVSHGLRCDDEKIRALVMLNVSMTLKQMQAL